MVSFADSQGTASMMKLQKNPAMGPKACIWPCVQDTYSTHASGGKSDKANCNN